MSTRKADLVQGTLDLLILKTIAAGPLHGYGIAQRILATSNEILRVQQGSLYPGLQRMRRKGWIRSEWRVTENNRKARYYLLTAAGARQLGPSRSLWARASEAVNRVLNAELDPEGA